MSENLSEEQVKEALESGYAQSEALLNSCSLFTPPFLSDFFYKKGNIVFTSMTSND